jgi:hypothetical protein
MEAGTVIRRVCHILDMQPISIAGLMKIKALCEFDMDNN